MVIGYDPYLHYYKPDYITDSLDFFSRPAIIHSAKIFPPHSYPPPEVEISTSERGSQESEIATYGIWIPASEGDTSGVFCFLLDGLLQDAPETTTLLTSDKLKDDLTTEMIWIH